MRKLLSVFLCLALLLSALGFCAAEESASVMEEAINGALPSNSPAPELEPIAEAPTASAPASDAAPTPSAAPSDALPTEQAAQPTEVCSRQPEPLESADASVGPTAVASNEPAVSVDPTPVASADPEPSDSPTMVASEAPDMGTPAPSDDASADETAEPTPEAPPEVALQAATAVFVPDATAFNGVARFTCQVTPALEGVRYRWQRLRQGGAAGEEGAQAPWEDIPRGSASTLKLTALTEAKNAGDLYRCLIGEGEDAVPSNAARISSFALLPSPDPALLFSLNMRTSEATLINLIGAPDEAFVPERFAVDGVLYTVTSVCFWTGSARDASGESVDRPLAGTLHLPKTIQTVTTRREYGTNLCAISIDADCPNFRTQDGLLYDGGGKTLLLCPKGVRGGISLLQTTERVSGFAFLDCAQLTDVSFPETLSRVGRNAFLGCSALSRLTFSAKKTVFEGGAMANTGAPGLTLWGHFDSNIRAVAGRFGHRYECLLYQMAVDRTMNVDTQTIQYANLTRAPGFAGPIARVTGTLTLDHAAIEGVNAGSANLAEIFLVAANGGICVTEGAQLEMSHALICLDRTRAARLSLRFDGQWIKQSAALWASSDRQIAAVDRNGNVKALKKGSAVISAKYGGLSVSCAVIVTEPVARVTINPAAYTIDVGTARQLCAVCAPENADDKTLTWQSSDAAVASVDGEGLVTARAPGVARIVATSRFGSYCAVYVSVIQPVTAMRIIPQFTLDVGRYTRFLPEFEPENATYKTAAYASSDPKIAYVNAQGYVRGMKAGTCSVTATSHNGIASVCEITVVQPVTSVRISKTAAAASLNRIYQLYAAALPADATDPSLVWSSTNPAVATVDETGLVNCLSVGRTYVVATASSGKWAACRLDVMLVNPTAVYANQLYVTMHPGETYASVFTMAPAMPSDPTILYTSSDEAVASVDDQGVVTAVGCGSAYITATASANPRAADVYKVCVIEAGAPRMAGLVIGINPGHQKYGIKKQYPIAPGSSQTAAGCKVGAGGRFTHLAEYITNLAISVKLRDLLTEAGATVVMTRTANNVSITNIARAAMLNEANVDVALQVHCNAQSNGTSAHGLSCYVRPSGFWAAESKFLAKSLSWQMSAATGAKNLGVYYSNDYTSLNWSTTPSILLEMGYLSNKTEDYLLASDEYRQKMAQGIFNGLAAYFGR